MRTTFSFVQQSVAKLWGKGNFSTCGCFWSRLSYGSDTVSGKEKKLEGMLQSRQHNGNQGAERGEDLQRAC